MLKLILVGVSRVRFKHGEVPLPFDSDPVALDSDDCCPEFVCSMHADKAFIIPPQSEIIVQIECRIALS